MGEFSAHRVTIAPGEKIVIATDVNLYVSTIGDDVLNSGVEEASPFRTPQRALEWLGDKYISDLGFVTINFAAGIYDITEQLVLDHAQGSRIAILGAEAETLILKYVSDYRTYGFTASDAMHYFSGVTHAISMTCVRPDDATKFVPITSTNSLYSRFRTSGSGVIIEDYDLVYDSDYNPVYFYAAYPHDTRNNILRQSSILGCHRLSNVSLGQISVTSSIRDDWFVIPAGSTTAWGRMYGNAQSGASFNAGSCANAADTSEIQSNAWLFSAANLGNTWIRGHYLSNVPVGYYGNSITTGIPVGATSNFVAVLFPNSSASGATAGFTYTDITNAATVSWYTATGPAGSFLNDSARFGNNYHEHVVVSGRDGIGSSSGWKTVNTNTITVKILPTVFRRFGNILNIKASGLRKIKNIYFDGKGMPSHYGMLGQGSMQTSNKVAIYAAGSNLGGSVHNEPQNFGDGLCTNVGIQDFHIGFFADAGSNVSLGKLIVSNCSTGIRAADNSSITTTGSVCTGMASMGFASVSASSLKADRCFSAFSGQSLVTLRFKQAGLTQSFSPTSFVAGQTFATPDNRIHGTVWDWDPREKIMTLAVRTGYCEGMDPTLSR